MEKVDLPEPQMGKEGQAWVCRQQWSVFLWYKVGLKGTRQMSRLEACSISSLNHESQPMFERQGPAIERAPRHLSALHEIPVAQDGSCILLQRRCKTSHNPYEHTAEPCLHEILRKSKNRNQSSNCRAVSTNFFLSQSTLTYLIDLIRPRDY